MFWTFLFSFNVFLMYELQCRSLTEMFSKSLRLFYVSRLTNFVVYVIIWVYSVLSFQTFDPIHFFVSSVMLWRLKGFLRPVPLPWWCALTCGVRLSRCLSPGQQAVAVLWRSWMWGVSWAHWWRRTAQRRDVIALTPAAASCRACLSEESPPFSPSTSFCGWYNIFKKFYSIV